MNSVILTGRLTRDPELKALESGNLCSFTLAVDNGKNNTAFLPCSVYGDKADLMLKTLRKGSPIAVQGRIEQRVFETQTGEKRTVVSIYVESFEYMDKKASTTEDKPREPKAYTPEDIGKLDLPDDDLPF